jgi:dihydropteroate synthase-like protein
MTPDGRILFVTGKLAEPALRRVLADLAPRAGFAFDVAVLPITVAALLTAPWIARRLKVPADTARVVLPGMCGGDLAAVQAVSSAPVELGPKDLRDLPEFFGEAKPPAPEYGKSDIEILAEINHVPKKAAADVLRVARQMHADGADVIDLGCVHGSSWDGVGECVRMLREDDLRVSIDSFDAAEVEAALAAGAELVLSVNGANVANAKRWAETFPKVEVVAIPDSPADLDSLHRTAEKLQSWGVKYRLDPVLEPIGFGFAASLARYQEVRKRYPDAGLLMGVGNLSELTDADSGGVNVLLAGFCQEVGVRSVLTTEVANHSRTSVKEFALARRLVRHAVVNKVIPKKLEPDLVLLRDPKLYTQGSEALAELAERITDRNYRLFAERGEIHVLNDDMYLRGTDPFALFAEMLKRDSKLDAAHSFYLGYEFAKAVTALTLGKNYEQDRALRWGFLTVPEVSHRRVEPRPVEPRPPGSGDDTAGE